MIELTEEQVARLRKGFTVRAVLRTKRDEGFAVEEIEMRLPRRESVTPYPPFRLPIGDAK